MKRLRHAELLGAAVVLIVMHALAIGDHAASDPVAYADIAHRLAQAPLDTALTAHPFHMRIGLTWPLALLYRVFGVSAYVTHLPMLFAQLAILVVVYAAGETPRARRIGLALVLACTPLLSLAVVLGVDLVCGALLGVAVLCLARRERGRRYLVAAVLASFAAFLVKETAVWCAPLWLYVAIVDGRAGRPGRAYVPAIAVGLGCIAAYLVLCAVVWGDPLARFRGIEELDHAWSLRDAPAAAWAERLGAGPPRFLLGLFPGTLPAALLAARVRPARIWWVALVMFLALFWFGSASFAEYAPLPLRPRMVIVLIAPLLVAATFAFDALVARSRRAGLVLLAATVLWGAYGQVRFLLRPHPEVSSLARVAELARTGPVTLVCGDPRCPAFVSYYAGFPRAPAWNVTFAPDFGSAPFAPGARVLALVNTGRSPRADWYDPAADPRHYDVAMITALGLPTLVAQRGVRLYDAGDGQALWRALQPPRDTPGP